MTFAIPATGPMVTGRSPLPQLSARLPAHKRNAPVINPAVVLRVRALSLSYDDLQRNYGGDWWTAYRSYAAHWGVPLMVPKADVARIKAEAVALNGEASAWPMAAE